MSSAGASGTGPQQKVVLNSVVEQISPAGAVRSGVNGATRSRRPGSLAQEAYVSLRDAIISGELEPEEPLSEVALAERLGISRTPVREALARLATDGLVRTSPGLGSRVAGISLTDINDLFQVREALEVLAARLAAQNSRFSTEDLERLIEQFTPFLTTGGDPSFDEYYRLTGNLDDVLIARAGNRRLEEALRDVWSHSRRLRRYASHSVSRLEAGAGEHIAILRAVLSGDLDAVDTAVRIHMQNSRKALLAKVLGEHT